MIHFYKTIDNQITQIDALAAGAWINVIQPTAQEISYLMETLQIDSGFIRSSLDEEESSRIENEGNQTLVIVDVPMKETENAESYLAFTTMPMGIILTEEYILTISLRENTVISILASGTVKNLNTALRTRFLLNLLLRVSARFLVDLKQIDRISSETERRLHKSMKNEELFQLMGLEKSLVYFSTSLKSNEITLEKILRGRFIKMYEEDQDLLEDVIIEVKQAIEMCNIYSGILSGTMDAFASIISNNLNIVMKILASLTIIMAIPTIVFSFYGMNVNYLPLANEWFPLALSLVLTLVSGIVLYKKGMFH